MGSSFPEVCETLGFDRESAARCIQLLRLVGAVKLVRVQERDGFLGESDLDRHDDEQVCAGYPGHKGKDLRYAQDNARLAYPGKIRRPLRRRA